MSERRILRTHRGVYALAREAPFESEAELHRAIAEHPEVLPSDELGLGVLVPVSTELDLGSGPMDLLTVDAKGRAVIVEFKRGTENPDVRKVIAQLLDYGSALWRTGYDDLEQACRDHEQLEGDGLVEHVAARLDALDVAFDAAVFRSGLEAVFDSGDFVFLYVARDLDRRTQRIMTYLGEGPRLSMFAVEVDHYRFDTGDAVLVPRVAFVPSWVAERGASRVQPARKRLEELLADADDDVREVERRLRRLADELGAVVWDSDRARNVRPAAGRPGIALYPTFRSVAFWLQSFWDRGQDEVAERFRTVIQQLHPDREPARKEPSLPVGVLLSHWERAEAKLLRPYLQARLEHVHERENE